MLSSQVDALKSCGNIFYKPYQEYKHRHDSPQSDTRSLASSHDQESSHSSMTATATSPEKKNVAGKMVAASAKSMGDLYSKGFKAATVDIPLAAAEGLKNVPALYGDKVRDNGRVTDWKSGCVVGGKVR